MYIPADFSEIKSQEQVKRALEQTRNELLRERILKTAKVISANNEALCAES